MTLRLFKYIIVLSVSFSFLSPSLIFAQKKAAYIASDSSLIGGEISQNGDIDNTRVVRFRKNVNERFKEYSAREIKEYGLKDGRIFQAYEDPSRKGDFRFFEVIYQGKYTLYSLPTENDERLFIKRLNTISLDEFPATDLEDFIINYFEICEAISRNAQFVKRNKSSLKRFVSRYEQCGKSQFPRFRYGFLVGVTVNQFVLKNPKQTDPPDLPVSTGKYIGISFDLPIGFNNFSLNTGLTVGQIKNSKLYTYDESTYDLIINQVRLNMPLLVRYTAFSTKFNPFIETGFTISKYIDGTNYLVQFTSPEEDVLIDYHYSSILSDIHVGFSANVGITMNYDSKSSLFLKAGISNLYPTRKNGFNDLISNNQLSQIRIAVGLIR